jgi:hypothetical protein
MVSVYDVRDTRLFTYPLTLNAFGSAHSILAPGPEVALGDYALDVEVAGEYYRQTFKVEDYPQSDYQLIVGDGSYQTVSIFEVVEIYSVAEKLFLTRGDPQQCVGELFTFTVTATVRSTMSSGRTSTASPTS